MVPTKNFISTFKGNSKRSWAMCYAAGLSSVGTWYLSPCTGPSAAVGTHVSPRFLKILYCWDTWLFWDTADTKGQQPSTLWILLCSPSFAAGKMLPASVILHHAPSFSNPLDPTASAGTCCQPCNMGRQHRGPGHRAAQTDPRHESLQRLYIKKSFKAAKILTPTKK